MGSAIACTHTTHTRWLRAINGSAVESLKEGMDDLLVLHQIGVPFALRRSLRSTNTIEGVFSRVRFYEKGIKRYRSSGMAQRWLGTVLLNCERGFRKIKGQSVDQERHGINRQVSGRA